VSVATLAFSTAVARRDARIALGPTPFLIALLIAITTIGGHAFRVARANPIHALRYE